MVVQLTLNDVIEVYEEKIHEVQLARGDAEQHQSDAQRARSEVSDALAILTNTKGCRSAEHKEYASRFSSSWSYRRLQTYERDGNG